MSVALAVRLNGSKIDDHTVGSILICSLVDADNVELKQDGHKKSFGDTFNQQPAASFHIVQKVAGRPAVGHGSGAAGSMLLLSFGGMERKQRQEPSPRSLYTQCSRISRPNAELRLKPGRRRLRFRRRLRRMRHFGERQKKRRRRRRRRRREAQAEAAKQTPSDSDGCDSDVPKGPKTRSHPGSATRTKRDGTSTSRLLNRLPSPLLESNVDTFHPENVNWPSTHEDVGLWLATVATSDFRQDPTPQDPRDSRAKARARGQDDPETHHWESILEVQGRRMLAYLDRTEAPEDIKQCLLSVNPYLTSGSDLNRVRTLPKMPLSRLSLRTRFLSNRVRAPGSPKARI
ncbi:hypothetical protein BC567DRAFT_205220 [Phyllosticta citribraziliensis]